MHESPVSEAGADRSDRVPRRTAMARLAGGSAAGLLAAMSLAGDRPWLAAAQSGTPEAGGGAHVVVRMYELAPDATIDELSRRVAEGFVPIVSQIPGFVDYALVDVDGKKNFSISVFASPENAEESTRAAADWVAANVAQLVAGPPVVTSGTVRVHAEAAAE